MCTHALLIAMDPIRKSRYIARYVEEWGVSPNENKKVYWFLGFLVLSFMVSKLLGFEVSWFLSFVVSWILGFEVSWFHSFKVSTII